MAALSRPTEATYTIHESVTVDTTDREDHTFCGIMFPIKAKMALPVHSIVINSISVRGRLGPLTVWVTKDDESDGSSRGTANAAAASSSSARASSSSSSSSSRYDLRRTTQQSRTATIRGGQGEGTGEISMKQKHWTKIYQRNHPPSFHDYCELDLSSDPVILKPGQVRGLYIHSTLPGDEAIVYDNKQKRLTHDDGFITVMPGRAHVSERPFGTNPIWGWGNAWRDNREFVGRVSYGAVYRLWNPKEHLSFGGKFQTLVTTLFACQRRWESPISMLPDDAIFFILNMCRWDWVDDTAEDIGVDQRKMRRLVRRRQKAAAEEEEAVEGEEMEEDGKMPAVATAAAAPTGAVARGDLLVVGEDEMDEDDDDDDYSEDDGGSDDSDSYDEYRNMDSSTFYYRDYEEEDSDDDNEAAQAQRNEETRRTWLRSQFARVSVLRALASMNDGGEAEAATMHDG